MLTTAQCQKPVTVGASGSHIVTTKLCVPDGKPLQESCGETSWPPAPKMPLTCGIASFLPSFRSVLVSENEAAGGRLSYGFLLIWLLLFLQSSSLESQEGQEPRRSACIVYAPSSSRTLRKPCRSYSPTAGLSFSTLRLIDAYPSARARTISAASSSDPAPDPRLLGTTAIESSGVSSSTNP